jgi:hypothetical protein
MIVIGYRLLNDYAALWKLAADCAALLGTAEELMGLAEDATASALEPWDKLPRRPWPQGRVFGGYGELRWRSYGPTVRVALVADAGEDAGQAFIERLEALGFQGIQSPALTAVDGDLMLWRGGYADAQIRRYLDEVGVEQFVRYRSVVAK